MRMETPETIATTRGPALGHSTPNIISSLFVRDSGTPRLVRAGGVIFLQDEPVDRIYDIVSGTVRCHLTSEEGHRQVLRFATPGDVLGVAAGAAWHFSAEAVDDVVVRSITRDRFERALATDPAMTAAVRESVLQEVERLETHLMTLSSLRAMERLARFLEAFSTAGRRSGGYTVLPMTRQDIGDHLGLSLETVSRAFGELKRCARIHMQGPDRYRLSDRASAPLIAA